MRWKVILFILLVWLWGCSSPCSINNAWRDWWLIHPVLGFEDYPKVVLDYEKGYEKGYRICGYLGDGKFVLAKTSTPGDTLKIYDSVSNTYSSEIYLNDGNRTLAFSYDRSYKLNRSEYIPVVSNDGSIFLFNITNNTYIFLVKITNIPPSDITDTLNGFLDIDGQKKSVLIWVWWPADYYFISNDTYYRVTNVEGVFISSNGELKKIVDEDVWVIEKKVVEKKTYFRLFFGNISYVLVDYVIKNYKRNEEIGLRNLKNVEDKIISTINNADKPPFRDEIPAHLDDPSMIFITSDLKYLVAIPFIGFNIGGEGFTNTTIIDISSKTSGIQP